MSDHKENDRSLQELSDETFGNYVIVKRVCSYMTLVRDLLSLRPLNRLFQEEASKRIIGIGHIPIDLTTEDLIKKFLKCARIHFDLQLTPFLFSSFKLRLPLWNDFVLETFAREIGPHVSRYSFTPVRGARGSGPYANLIFSMTDIQGELAILLSHSPELTEIHLKTARPIFFSEQRNLDLIPASFPKLQVIDVNYECKDFPLWKGNENENPLVEVLISRAAQYQLKSFVIPTPLYPLTPDMEPLYLAIFRHYDGTFPRLSFPAGLVLEIGQNNINFVKQFIQMEYAFTDLSIALNLESDQTEGNNYEIQRQVTLWLVTQMDTLTSLSIDLGEYQGVTFLFPPLNRLLDFTIGFPNEDEPGAQPACPMHSSHIPILQKLCLKRYKEGYRFLDSTPLSTVKHLHLSGYRGPLTQPSWNLTFPNLTSLHLDVDCEVEGSAPGPNIGFVLTHFAHIVHLDIEFTGMFFICGCMDFWDVLTGGAPRPADRLELLRGHVDRVKGRLPKPVDGIYQVPSLANLKVLKTLRLTPLDPGTLDAILYATLTGLLVPLQKLSLHHVDYDHLELEEIESATFHDRLTSVHANVEWNSKPGYPVNIRREDVDEEDSDSVPQY